VEHVKGCRGTNACVSLQLPKSVLCVFG
jgi:hypothetical protein